MDEVDVAIGAIKAIARRLNKAKSDFELARIMWKDAGEVLDGIVQEKLTAENKLLVLLNKAP